MEESRYFVGEEPLGELGSLDVLGNKETVDDGAVEVVENSPTRRRNQAFSHAASEAAMNSASQVERAVECCSRERQLMGPPREKKMYPVHDRRVSLSAAWSLSTKHSRGPLRSCSSLACIGYASLPYMRP